MSKECTVTTSPIAPWHGDGRGITLIVEVKDVCVLTTNLTEEQARELICKLQHTLYQLENGVRV